MKDEFEYEEVEKLNEELSKKERVQIKLILIM